MKKFKLLPFANEISLQQLELSGWIDRQDNSLSIEYQLQGNLNPIAISAPANAPKRRPELWQDTCLEFFIGIPNDRSYWEFNLSPSGNWNVFHLDDYRQNLREELAFSTLPFTVERQANSAIVNLKIDVSKIISIEQKIEASVTAVIKSNRDEISYWALTHQGKEADFHLRDSFIITL